MCPGDFDCSRAVNSSDFFAFLAAFFDGGYLSDFNNNGESDSNDFFAFLDAFFAPCTF